MLSKAIEKRLVIGYELGFQSAEDAITAVPNLSRCRAGATGDAVHRAPSRRTAQRQGRRGRRCIREAENIDLAPHISCELTPPMERTQAFGISYR